MSTTYDKRKIVTEMQDNTIKYEMFVFNSINNFLFSFFLSSFNLFNNLSSSAFHSRCEMPNKAICTLSSKAENIENIEIEIPNASFPNLTSK